MPADAPESVWRGQGADSAQIDAPWSRNRRLTNNGADTDPLSTQPGPL